MNDFSLIERYYKIPWKLLKVTLNNRSSLEFTSTTIKSKKQASQYIKMHYGYDLDNPEHWVKTQKVFNTAIDFIQKNFLNESINFDTKLVIPDKIIKSTDVRQLLVFAGKKNPHNAKLGLWACAVLRVMNVIVHIMDTRPYDDTRIIRQQIYDRFNHFIHTDEKKHIYFGKENFQIPLQSFTLKLEKTMESVIIKLLSRSIINIKEVFDHLGVRIVTRRKCDVLAILEFLREHNVISFVNIHHDRTRNTLVDINRTQYHFDKCLKEFQNNKLDPNIFFKRLESIHYYPDTKPASYNVHTSNFYRSLHLTCMQLIHYPNPIHVRLAAIHKKVCRTLKNFPQKQKLILDEVNLNQFDPEVRFFFPYEIQLTDFHSHQTNTQGYAAHDEYKRSKILSARQNTLLGLL